MNGFMSDLWSLWTSPGTLFQRLREKAPVVIPLFVLLVVITLSTAIALPVLTETMVEKAEESIRKQGGDPAGLRFLEHPAMKAGIVVVAPIMILILLLAYTLAAYLILTLTGGVDEPKPFGRLFAVVTWSKLVEIPHMLLWVPIALLSRNAEVYFGPAALLSADSPEWLLQIVAAFDLFTLWFLGLFILGASVVLRISMGRAALAVLLPWGLWQVLKLIPQLL